jgi:hypothetical protein
MAHIMLLVIIVEVDDFYENIIDPMAIIINGD